MTVIGILAFSILAAAKSPSTYIQSCFLRPCEIKGDFDGDKKPDRALLVKNKAGKKGVQVKFANGQEAIFGAGVEIGDGGSDLSWMDTWELHKGTIEQGADESAPPPKPKGDSLSVAKEESASAIVYWDGKQFRWYQQGD